MPDSWWPHGLQQQSSLSFTVSWSLLTHVHGVGAATPATESVSSHSKRLHMSYSDSDSVSISLTHTCLQPTPFSSSLVSKTLTLFVLLLPIFLFIFFVIKKYREFIFQSSSGFIEKLSRKYRKFPYTSLPPQFPLRLRFWISVAYLISSMS